MLRDLKYQTDHLHSTCIEFRFKLREGTKLCGANRSEVCRVGEQDCPFAVKELVEVKVANGSLGLEVGGCMLCQPHLFRRYTSYTYQPIRVSTLAAQQEAQFHDEAVGQQGAGSSALAALRSEELGKLHEEGRKPSRGLCKMILMLEDTSKLVNGSSGTTKNDRGGMNF
jgi:hypothetical protein